MAKPATWTAGLGTLLVTINLWGSASAKEHVSLANQAVEAFSDDPHGLTELVAESLSHGPPPPLRLSDNWILWLAGPIVPGIRVSQSPDRLAAGGRGLCSDAVIVLNALAERAGFEAEMFDLNGHVVSELRAHGGVWVADPDLGLVHAGSVADLASPERVAQVHGAVLEAGHGADIADACATAWATPDDNRRVPGGVLNPRLWILERISEWLRWIVPLALLAWGIAARPRPTPTRSSPGASS